MFRIIRGFFEQVSERIIWFFVFKRFLIGVKNPSNFNTVAIDCYGTPPSMSIFLKIAQFSQEVCTAKVIITQR